MVKTKEEILSSLKVILGDNTSDEAISLLEDISDSMSNDTSALSNEVEEWKTKYSELDTTWRNKYRDRFYSGTEDDDTDLKDDFEPKSLSYENLFTEGEKK